ncbi:MAG: hypothetical protein C5B47_01420 [Verrucomicrobia bacterium]|nr:MAG: hypothetical protein C5B47_01420 [Verrucomicrobiota bacterium]
MLKFRSSLFRLPNPVAHAKILLKQPVQADYKKPSFKNIFESRVTYAPGSSPKRLYYSQFGFTFDTPESKRKVNYKLEASLTLSRAEKDLLKNSFTKGYEATFPTAEKIRRSRMERFLSFLRALGPQFSHKPSKDVAHLVAGSGSNLETGEEINKTDRHSPAQPGETEENIRVAYDAIKNDETEAQISKLLKNANTRPAVTDLRVQAFQDGCLAGYMDQCHETKLAQQSGGIRQSEANQQPGASGNPETSITEKNLQ